MSATNQMDDSSFEISLGSIEEEKGIEVPDEIKSTQPPAEVLDEGVKQTIETMIANVDNMLDAQEAENDAKDVAEIESKLKQENKPVNETATIEPTKNDKDDLEISVFDEDEIEKTDSMLEEKIDNKKDEYEHIANTEINGVPTEVVISKNKTKQMTDEEINERVEKAANNQIPATLVIPVVSVSRHLPSCASATVVWRSSSVTL